MRLLLIAIATSLLFMSAIFFTLRGTDEVSQQFTDFINQDQKRLGTLQVMQAEGSQAIIAAAKKIMVPALKPPADVAAKAAQEFDKALQQAQLLYSGETQGQEGIKRISELWSECRPDTLAVIRLIDEARNDEAQVLFNEKVQKAWGSIRKQLQPLMAREAERVAETQTTVSQQVKRTFQAGVGLGVLALLSALAMNLLGSRSIVRSINNVASALEKIGSEGGDLTCRLPAEGGIELVRLASGFNQFVAKTQDLMTQVAASTQQMNECSSELSEVARSSRSTADQQDEAMQQVATAMTQMAVAVKSVAESAAHAASLAETADSQAKDGNQVVSRTIQAIRTLSSDVEKASDDMRALEQETNQVEMVVSVIKGIAEQTNLLALNAAIEAARAGEMGRGFAVVADEVRTLASRTQSSTREIIEIIERLQEGAHRTATMMEESRNSVQQTLDQASQAGNALTTITEAVAEIRDMNVNIASAAEEQQSVSDEIHRNTLSVGELSQQSKESTVLTEGAGQELRSIASQITRLVGRFKVA
ncbi:MAG: methyl-accepting chemotaxis protein [Candidatus Thiodiazotropha sp.]